MTTQSSTPRAKANMALAKINNAAAAFWSGLSALLMTVVFLCAVVAFAIPIGHHVWSWWWSAAASLQAPAPAPTKAAAKK